MILDSYMTEISYTNEVLWQLLIIQKKKKNISLPYCRLHQKLVYVVFILLFLN